MIVRSNPEGLVLFTQSAHALLAFQLAEHWGNRHTPRPSPRAEVLAAVLLHDAGWDRRDQAPRLLPDGTIADFQSWPPEEEREQLWLESLASARTRGRYVEYLVGHHILDLAETYSPGRYQAFVAGLRDRLRTLAHQLQAEPRYAQVFATGQDEANRQILRVVDALALNLCLGPGRRMPIPGAPTKQGHKTLRLREQEPGTVRLHPWPFVGRQLTVWAEGTFLPATALPAREGLASAWERAALRPFTWRVLRWGVAP